MKQYFSRIILVLLIVRLVTYCASLIHGSSEEVNITSSTDNAGTWVDGARINKTPTRLPLKRGDTHAIKIQKNG